MDEWDLSMQLPSSSKRRRSARRARTSVARWRSVASCASRDPVPSIIDVLYVHNIDIIM